MVEHLEPGVLPEVRALSGGLEEKPLELLVLVLFGGGGDPVLRVVLLDEVCQDGASLPVGCIGMS